MAESTVDFLPRIDKMMPRRLDSALFGMGHFFNFEPRFGVAKGVWRTAVGYSGGRCENPSYEDPGDHMGVVMVEYDPLALNYGQLLDIFLNRCGCKDVIPISQNASFQCISCVLVKNEFERRMAQAAVSRYELRSGYENSVKVAMYRSFHKAEKWCQKHFLRKLKPLMDELSRIYQDEDRLIQSTLATRLNGILGQRSLQEPSASYVPEDFEFYDLSECAANILKKGMEFSA
jgi:peptide-methionine (S)-S-oxide reductase